MRLIKKGRELDGRKTLSLHLKQEKQILPAVESLFLLFHYFHMKFCFLCVFPLPFLSFTFFLKFLSRPKDLPYKSTICKTLDKPLNESFRFL